MKFPKSTSFSAFFLAAILLLSGCAGSAAGSSGENATAYSQTLRDIAEDIGGEPFRLAATEDTEPDPERNAIERTYTFQSSRGEFHAYSEITADGRDYENGKARLIGCDYPRMIRQLYAARIDEVLGDKNVIDLSGPFDSEEMLRSIMAADAIYAEELAHHKEAWLRANPVRTLYFVYYPETLEDGVFQAERIDVNGCNTREALEEEFEIIDHIREIAALQVAATEGSEAVFWGEPLKMRSTQAFTELYAMAAAALESPPVEKARLESVEYYEQNEFVFHFHGVREQAEALGVDMDMDLLARRVPLDDSSLLLAPSGGWLVKDGKTYGMEYLDIHAVLSLFRPFMA